MPLFQTSRSEPSNTWQSRSGPLRLAPDAPLPDDGGPRRLACFVGVLLTGILITWLVYTLISRQREQQARIAFERDANQLEAKLQSQFDLSIEYLKAIPPFFQASDDVTQAEFELFVRDAIERHPGIYTFEYLPRVRANEQHAYEERMARELDQPDFQIRAVDEAGRPIPLPESDDYYPITFGKPLIKQVLGIDLASHPEQGGYLREATTSRTAVATPPVSLIEHEADERSLIAFGPHHSPDDSNPPSCLGIAVLILAIDPVVETAMRDWQSEDFQVAIIDTDEDPDAIIYKNFQGDSIALPRANWPVESLQIRFADQQWLFQVAPKSLSQFSNPPYWVLLTGLALSALVANSLSAGLLIGGLRKQVDAALELGQYRLGKKLGEGGMGIVYEAEHCMLARPAAIKLIQLDEKSDDPESVSQRSLKLNRFEKEAQATAQLESPHTIGIYDFGRVPDGRFYYVMELLHGTDLSTLIKEFGPIPPARMIHLVRQACRSLAEAHAAGLIHRDIKPANIFVCRYAGEYDFVKVLDFGLVKSSSPAVDLDITRPGSFIGTPAFVAPEMLLEKDVDGRTDLYSLGCVMYWLLTGRPPFTASTATAMMAKHQTEQPTSLRAVLGDTISVRLDEIVLSCLAKKPENRPPSAVEVGKSLAACATEAPWTQAQAKACWQREQESETPREPEPTLHES